MANWNQVAYDNAMSALKGGASASSVLSSGAGYDGGKYLPYMQAAVKAYTPPKAASAPRPVSRSSSSGNVTAPAKQAAPETPSAGPVNIPPAPDLVLPALKFDEGASPGYQLDKIMSKDSIPMQRARITAHEKGVTSGAIHGSQQEGAAMRSMYDVAEPMADKEASLIAGENISNWQNKANEAMTVYQARYSERLNLQNISASLRTAMASSNTALTQTLMNNISSMYSNNEFEISQGSIDKLMSVIDTGQDNNNLILNMGFKY